MSKGRFLRPEIIFIYFRFPNNIERRVKWTNNLRRAMSNFTPDEKSRICSDHFLESHLWRGPERAVVREHGEPTRFNTFPVHLRMVITIYLSIS